MEQGTNGANLSAQCQQAGFPDDTMPISFEQFSAPLPAAAQHASSTVGDMAGDLPESFDLPGVGGSDEDFVHDAVRTHMDVVTEEDAKQLPLPTQEKYPPIEDSINAAARVTRFDVRMAFPTLAAEAELSPSAGFDASTGCSFGSGLTNADQHGVPPYIAPTPMSAVQPYDAQDQEVSHDHSEGHQTSVPVAQNHNTSLHTAAMEAIAKMLPTSTAPPGFDVNAMAAMFTATLATMQAGAVPGSQVPGSMHVDPVAAVRVAVPVVPMAAQRQYHLATASSIADAAPTALPAEPSLPNVAPLESVCPQRILQHIGPMNPAQRRMLAGQAKYKRPAAAPSDGKQGSAHVEVRPDLV